MNTLTNLFKDIPENLPAELIESILLNPHVRIERIVSQGHTSPEGFWYDQVQNEWVLLIQGSAQIRFDDEIVELKPGDFINIAAHRRHRVEHTESTPQTIWLAIHYDNS